jgi:glycosyltransferase involved in cell wall biosynthesis
MSVNPSDDFWAEKYQALWPRTDAVTVLSEDMKEKAQHAGCPASKISIVHLSRDLGNFLFEPPQRSAEKVLFVGRMVAKKAPLDALEAVRLANAAGGSFHLDMVGDGPLQEEVERYVGEHGLGTVSIHGRVSSAEVAHYMREADAFLLPSKTAPNGDQEGTPTVLIEAQAVGLPCVTTRHAGIPEMIPEENHDLLSAPGEVESLAQSLIELRNASVDEIREKAEWGRHKVERDFNLSTEVRKLLALYREVGGGRRDGSH